MSPPHPKAQADDGSLPAPSLAEVSGAIVSSWGDDTMYATKEPPRKPGDRSRGQCGTTALVPQDWMGGSLMTADVFRDGVLVGAHYWNCLPDGQEVDLTRSQFISTESLGKPREVTRPPEESFQDHPGYFPYLVLRRRVEDLLGRHTVPPSPSQGEVA